MSDLRASTTDHNQLDRNIAVCLEKLVDTVEHTLSQVTLSGGASRETLDGINRKLEAIVNAVGEGPSKRPRSEAGGGGRSQSSIPAPSTGGPAGGRIIIDRDLATVNQVWVEWISESRNPRPLYEYYDEHGGWAGWRDLKEDTGKAEQRNWNDTRRLIFIMIASMVDRNVYSGTKVGDYDAFIKYVRPPVDARILRAVEALHVWQSQVCPPQGGGNSSLRRFSDYIKAQNRAINGFIDVQALLGQSGRGRNQRVTRG